MANIDQIVYTSLFAPLAKIPGPWYSKWTGWVLTYNTFLGDGPRYVHQLHEKYG